MKKKITFLVLILFALSFLPVQSGVKLATLINTDGDKAIVEVGSQGAQYYFGRGYVLMTSDIVGFAIISSYKTTLSQSMSSTQSTVPVSSIATKDGHTITMADLGARVFLVIEPGASKEEIVMCTSISGSSWAGCTRGLSFYGTSTVAVSANRKTHSSGSTVVMSNVQYVYDQYADKTANNTFTGTNDFSQLPTSTTTAPTADGQLASKKYVDDTITAGAPDATETVKGIAELSTSAQAASGTSIGETGARLALPGSLASSTPGGNAAVIPVTGATGLLSPYFYQTNNNTWSGTNTFSGITTVTASTTFSTATTTFSGGVLGAGFIHMQVITTTGAGTWTKPIGVKLIKVRVVGGGGGGGASATAGGGGGAGGYAEKIMDVSATSSISYSVGTSASSSNFSTVIGAGGSSGTAPAGGIGGEGSGGDINIGGGDGTAGISSTAQCGGTGGSSALGGGGQGASNCGGFNGYAGHNYGGGGGGGGTGGAGAQGIIIIEY